MAFGGRPRNGPGERRAGRIRPCCGAAVRRARVSRHAARARCDPPFHARSRSARRVVATVFATEWGRDPAAAWRESVRDGDRRRRPLVFCASPARFCAYSMRAAPTRGGLPSSISSSSSRTPAAFKVFWFLLHADGVRHQAVTSLDRAVAESERYRAEVRTSLQSGVHDALTALLQAFRLGTRRTPVCAGIQQHCSKNR